MSGEGRVYAAIDLKSFYASVECVERGLDPLTTNLVVADVSRTEKTICLAVSPALKKYGISGRARLFEVVERVKQVNAQRLLRAPGRAFTGESYNEGELAAAPGLSLAYIAAPPRMAYYMDYSARVYHIYLKYIAPEDIHVYSVDEVFIDLTAYLKTYACTPRELTMRMIRDVHQTTGITATAGIGTNLYLAKIAMDIEAKHQAADKDGVRIAALDEDSYRRLLWAHRPLTDFWRVGRGISAKLEQNGLFTMGDVARCSLGGKNELKNEELLYKLFGINAELLIDHAWGYEPCTIKEIKAYRPMTSSVSVGQVLQKPYSFEDARLIVREMVDGLSLDLVERAAVTDQLDLTICYDTENLTDLAVRRAYHGPVTTDAYGRRAPKNAHGTENLARPMSSTKRLTDAAMALYDRLADPILTIRRIYIAANHLTPENAPQETPAFEQLDLLTDYQAEADKRRAEDEALAREREVQRALLKIRERYGKNAVLKGMSLQEGATAMERNGQIGGHKA